MMLISIHDKTLKRVAFIDNDKPETLHFYNDTWHRYLQEATSTFDFTVPKTGHTALTALNEQHYVSFRYADTDYLFNIMRIEETEDELTCYCENLNLELLNEISPAYEAPRAMTFKEYFDNSDIVGGQNFSDLVIGINEVSAYSRTLKWDGTDTKLARLLSLVNQFDAECEFVTELNRDGTLKRIVLNVYKKHDDTYQGVGTKRQDVTLFYGKSIDSIRRTVDKSELYSAINPIGKDGLSITEIEKTELDADGQVLYYTKKGSPNIYAPQTAENYPAQLSMDGDKWVLYRWDYDTDNVNTLYGQALAKLKEISVPALTYEIEGRFELNIGDTVTIYDEKFTPTLLLEARVSEQEVSFTDPTKNKNVFSNFKALENQLSSDITSRLEEMIQNARPYTVDILSDNGTVFKNGQGTTTLTARVMRGGMDVTEQVNLWWTKDETLVSTSNSITLTAVQVGAKALVRLSVKNSDQTELCFAEVTLINVLDGAEGVSATAIEEQYYLSTSDTTQTGGSWLPDCPEWEKGKYLWTRNKCSWSDGSITYTTPSLAGGLNSANDKADTALGEVDAVKIKVGELEAENVTITGKLEATEADISYLKAENITVSGKLDAVEADIGQLKAEDVTISGKLEAAEADITQLKAGKADIEDLNAMNAKIEKLEADIGNIGDLTAITADIKELKADVAEIDTALIGKADIDLANIKDGCITTAMIGEGVIGSAQIADGSITDAKIVGMTANKIKAGKLDASEIEVVNLNAANITVGTINGHQISDGAIDWDKLGKDVTDNIDNAVDTANNAQTTADGKNKIYYQASQPGTAGNKVGDTWFDTDDGYKIYRWNGSAWAAGSLGNSALADDSITASKIAAGAVTASEIATGAVNADKIAANAIIAGKIAANAVTSATIAANAVTADKISAGIISSKHLAANSITSDKIVADAITTAKIAAGAVTATELAAGCITATNGKIASIDASKITTGTLNAARIAAGTITSTHLASNSVTAAKIAADAVTAEKINVSTLSAITANLGTVTAGTIKSANYKAGSTGMQLTLSNGVWDSKNFKIASDGKVQLSGTLTIDSDYGGILFTYQGSKFAQINAEYDASPTVPSPNRSIVFRMGYGWGTESSPFSMDAWKDASVPMYGHKTRVDINADVVVFGTGEVTMYGPIEVMPGSAYDKNPRITGLGFLNSVYPVGSIYMSVNSTNPGTIFGGTWVELQGRFLLGRSSSYAAGSTGGAATVALTTAQIPSHDHVWNPNGKLNWVGNGSDGGGISMGGNDQRKTTATGSNASHNNMPPYLAVYIWKRTA